MPKSSSQSSQSSQSENEESENSKNTKNSKKSEKSEKTSKKQSNKDSKTSSSGLTKTEDIIIPKIDMREKLLHNEKKEKKIEGKTKEEKEEEERKEKEKKIQEQYLVEITKLDNEIRKYLPTPGRKYQEGDYLVECWKCNTLNLVHPSWDCIECSNCRTLCQIPKNYNNENIISLNRDDINKEKVSKKVNCIYTLLVCPKCKRSTKTSVFNDKFICPVCLNEFNILKPEINPQEKYCDSVDPHSHYYKFKFRNEPQYPPQNSIGISDLYFPDPVLYNSEYPYPVNPLGYYNMPYQEIETFKRFTKRYNLYQRLKNQYPITHIENKKDKIKVIHELQDLGKRMDRALQKKYYFGPINNYSITQDKNKGLSYSQSYVNNNYLDTRKQEKSKLVEDMFFMKKNKG